MGAHLYNEDLAERICVRIASGEMLKDVCADMGLASAKVVRWAANNTGGFREKLAEARRSHADQLVEEILAIANDCPLHSIAISRATMQIRARQWIVERLHPRSFVRPNVEVEDSEMKTIEPGDFLRQWQERNGPLTTN